MTYIILSTLCIFSFAVPSYTVFFTTENYIDRNVACTPFPTYRISDSSTTAPGETLYRVVIP